MEEYVKNLEFIRKRLKENKLTPEDVKELDQLIEMEETIQKLESIRKRLNEKKISPEYLKELDQVIGQYQNTISTTSW